jgi:biopolymer transport protein ExbD
MAGMTAHLIGCAGGHGKGFAAGDRRLTCLVLGYDSIIYYTGSSKEMRDVNNGKVTDTVFMNSMFKKIKDGGLSLAIKPGGGADVLDNFQGVVNLTNLYEVGRSVDSGDEYEEKAFGFVTPQVVKDAMNGQSHPEKLQLDLPRDEPDTARNAVSMFPKSSQLVVLISGDKDIYAYMGGEIQRGKKYTYPELTDMLKEERSDKDFSVVIKAAASSTYKNTVDMLDVMRNTDIKHYALVDITKKEEEFLHK